MVIGVCDVRPVNGGSVGVYSLASYPVDVVYEVAGYLNLSTLNVFYKVMKGSRQTSFCCVEAMKQLLIEMNEQKTVGFLISILQTMKITTDWDDEDAQNDNNYQYKIDIELSTGQTVGCRMLVDQNLAAISIGKDNSGLFFLPPWSVFESHGESFAVERQRIQQFILSYLTAPIKRVDFHHFQVEDYEAESMDTVYRRIESDELHLAFLVPVDEVRTTSWDGPLYAKEENVLIRFTQHNLRNYTEHVTQDILRMTPQKPAVLQSQFLLDFENHTFSSVVLPADMSDVDPLEYISDNEILKRSEFFLKWHQ